VGMARASCPGQLLPGQPRRAQRFGPQQAQERTTPPLHHRRVLGPSRALVMSLFTECSIASRTRIDGKAHLIAPLAGEGDARRSRESNGGSLKSAPRRSAVAVYEFVQPSNESIEGASRDVALDPEDTLVTFLLGDAMDIARTLSPVDVKVVGDD
jgi:hypothetical protein